MSISQVQGGAISAQRSRAVRDLDAQIVHLAAGEGGLKQAAAVVAEARSTPPRRRRHPKASSERTAV